jgi:hypothetical protein
MVAGIVLIKKNASFLVIKSKIIIRKGNSQLNRTNNPSNIYDWV